MKTISGAVTVVALIATVIFASLANLRHDPGDGYTAVFCGLFCAMAALVWITS